MNERIRELAEQAGVRLQARRPYFDEEPDGYLESDNDFTQNNMEAIITLIEQGGLEKFAELIVRECHDVVFKKTGPRSALNILEHFGIEE